MARGQNDGGAVFEPGTAVVRRGGETRLANSLNRRPQGGPVWGSVSSPRESSHSAATTEGSRF